VSLPKITLMRADEVGRPFHRDGWIYEEKYDGYDGWRMVAYTRCGLPLVSVSARLAETALE
jgi:hypothetical protein